MGQINTTILAKMTNNFIDFIISYGPKLLTTLVLFYVGLKLISWLTSTLEKIFLKTNFDEALESFIISFTSILLKIVLIISVANILGFPTTTMIAMLSAMAFAIGMALQGSLSNFAGGILILVFKPFSIGEFIETGSYKGTVKSIQIFQTKLLTPDGKLIIIPNGKLSNDPIINYTATGKRRVDFIANIGYENDIEKAKRILFSIVNNYQNRINDSDIDISVGKLNDSSVDIYCRFWVKTNMYLNATYYMNETVKDEFDKNDINIPYPQQDIHIIK